MARSLRVADHAATGTEAGWTETEKNMTTAREFLLAARRCEIRDLEKLAQSCALVLAVGELVHGLQRERGSSQIFLVSGGQRFGPELEACIGDSLASEARLRAWADGLEAGGDFTGGMRLLTRVAIVVEGLEALPLLREAIRTRQCSGAHSMQAYTQRVSALLALIFEVADVAVDPEVSRQLVALFNLIQGKEFAGQERAAGAGALAAGRCSDEGVQRLQHLQEQQELCLQRFESFCAPDILPQWRALQARMPLAELERLRRILATSTATEGLDPTLTDVWFELCSRRLDQIHLVEAHLAAQLKETCEHKIAASRAELERQQALPTAPPAEPPAPLAVLLAGGECDDAGEDTLLLGGSLGPHVTRSMMDYLQAQSQRLQALSDELAAVRATLNERKLVERAKGLLMEHQGLDEGAAYRLLRQTAMNQNRRIVDVAQAVLSMAELLPGRR